MNWINGSLRFLVEGLAGLFGGAHPLVGLTVIATLTGVGMLWVFGKTSNQRGIAEAKRKMQAYLLELRLYGDEPGPLLRAQGRLIAANFRYMGLMLVPALYLTAPMILLLFHLDAIYGIAAPRPGESVVLTVRAAEPFEADVEAPEIEAPAGFAIATPAVRAVEAREFSWRVEALAEGRGELHFRWRGREWTKSIDTAEEPRYVSFRRESSALDSIAAPGEPLLAVPGLSWVEIRYPAASIEAFGSRPHWLVWFLVISIAAAYLLKGAFGVTI